MSDAPSMLSPGVAPAGSTPATWNPAGVPTASQIPKNVKANTVVGSAGSLLPVDSSVVTATPTQNTPGKVSGGLSADVSEFNDSVEEVTLASSYYPATQPFLARLLLQFPSSLDEASITTTTAEDVPPNETAGPGLGVGTGTISILTTTQSLTPSFNNTTPEDDYLEIRPNNFLGLEYNRMTWGIGTFTITLFDPQWDKIEKRLVQNKGFFRSE